MKKFVSFCLAVILAFSFSVLSVSADESDLCYVVIGDSIAYGSGLRNAQKAVYGKVVADTNGYDYINHAVPGHTTDNLISKMSEETVNADLKRADIISISIGGNDFLMNNPSDLIFDVALEEDYSRIGETCDKFYENLCVIIDNINSINPDAVILMQTLYNPQSGDLGEIYQLAVDGLNEKISKYNDLHPDEIIIVDVGATFGNDMSNIAKDGIHPSAKGNLAITEIILERLYELGIGSSTEPVINEEGKNIFGSPFLDMGIKMMMFTVKVLAWIYKLMS